VATEIRKSTAATILFTTDSVWSSITGEVLSRTGSVLATPTPVANAADTTVASATDSSQFVLDSATAVFAGLSYLVTDDGWSQVVKVATVDGTTVTLVDPLPATPSVGATFKGGVSVALTVPAANTGTIGANYRARIYTTTNAQEQVEVFHVVYHIFAPAITQAELASLVSETWPSAEFGAVELGQIADQASARVSRALIASGRRPYLFGDKDAFKGAGKVAGRLELIDYGLIGPGWDPEDYERYYRSRFDREMGDAMASLTAIDDDNDDSLADEAGAVRVARMVL
jgi:hypothetical protein